MSDQTTDSVQGETQPSTAAVTAPPPTSGRKKIGWLLPLLLVIAVLLVLNLGLYLRLTNREQMQPEAQTAPEPAAAAQAAPEPVAAAATVESQPADAAAPIVPATVAGAAPWEYAAAFVDGEAPSAWLPFAGDWTTINNELVQRDLAGFDRGIVYTAQTFGNYKLAARFRLLQGTGAGVLFNLPQSDRKNGGHLVRFTDDGAGLFWGMFDEGGQFTGQGFAGVGAPGDAEHLLEVDVGADTYAIRLDGQALAGDIPLFNRSGYAGLMTNQASAAFAAFAASGSDGGVVVAPEVAAVAPTPAVAEATPLTETATTTTTTSTPLDLEAISGDWKQDGNTIYQLNSAATDFSLSTGIAGESYRLAVSITMSDAEELGNIGAGILFHMPDRTENNGAQLVRFVNAGKGLTWGSFDDVGAFRGDGYVELNLAPGAPHTLVLTVEGGKFAVSVDEQIALQDIPTVRDSGWLALTTFRGPVEFNDMQLQLGSIVK